MSCRSYMSPCTPSCCRPPRGSLSAFADANMVLGFYMDKTPSEKHCCANGMPWFGPAVLLASVSICCAPLAATEVIQRVG